MELHKLNNLRSERAETITQMHALINTAEGEERGLTKDERSNWETLAEKANELNDAIERQQFLITEERNKIVTANPAGVKASNGEWRSFLKGESRALSTSVDADGGYAVIADLNKMVMEKIVDLSPLRSLCNVVSTSAQTFEKLVSIGGATVGRGTEGSAFSGTNTPQMAKVSIPLNSVYAYPTTSIEIIDFSDVDIEGWLSQEISDLFALTEDDDFINGDGSSKPTGLLSVTAVETADDSRTFGQLEKMVAASGSAIDADELIDLFYKLKQRFRANAAWIMNSNTLASLVKLKNANGDYIYQQSLNSTTPGMLLGAPVYIVESMPDIGLSSTPIAVGDFNRGYQIVDHETGFRVRPDNLTSPGLLKVATSKYTGGAVLDSNAIKLYEMAAA